MKTRWIRRATLACAAAAIATTTGTPAAQAWGSGHPVLRGTYCWVLDPVLGKDTFVELTFAPIGNGQALFSGTAVRNDGNSPDRVLQMSGSASRHSFTGDGDVEITRHLLDLHYSFSKTGTDPANAFAETGAALRGHYALRLNPEDLSGAFEGNDIVLDFPGGLTGPSATHSSQNAANNAYFAVAGANNYLGALQCDGTVPGFDNCGTVLPINNAGSMTLIGDNRWECAAAAPNAAP